MGDECGSGGFGHTRARCVGYGAEDLKNALKTSAISSNGAQTCYVPPMAMVTARLYSAGDDMEEHDPWLRYTRIIFPVHRFRSDPR